MTERAIFIEDHASNAQSGPYSMGVMDNMVRAIMRWPDDSAGVIASAENELAASIVGGAVRIASGYAHIHGMIYWNDSNVDLTPTTPAVGDTRKRIVLRKEWDDPVSGSVSVQLTILEGTDGSTTLPALTQTDGTRWEIPICNFIVNTSGILSALSNDHFTVGDAVSDYESSVQRTSGRYIVAEFLGSYEPTATGTVQVGGWFATHPATYGDVTALSSSAMGAYRMAITSTVDTTAQIYTDPDLVNPTKNPRGTFVVYPEDGDAKLEEQFYGFTESPSIAMATASTHKAGILSTTTGNMFFYTSDGTTNETTDLGAVPTSKTVYVIGTDDGGVSWYCRQDGTLVATHSTNVPPTNQSMGGICELDSNTTSGTVQAFIYHVLITADK